MYEYILHQRKWEFQIFGKLLCFLCYIFIYTVYVTNTLKNISIYLPKVATTFENTETPHATTNDKAKTLNYMKARTD